MLQGIKKLYGPLLDVLDRVSAVKEAMELQACDGPASRDQKAGWPSARWPDCVTAIEEAMELQEEEGGRRGGGCKF